MDEIREALAPMPDLSKELRKPPPKLKRQVFEAFDLNVVYDKVENRIEISATVSEAVAEDFANKEDLPEEVHDVARTDIAGARYAPLSYARIREQIAA